MRYDTADRPAAPGLPLPSVAEASLLVAPPGPGPGHWAGAPAVWRADDAVYLAYRLRRPGERGYAVVLAASADGERFETVQVLGREDFACASLERPALVRAADGEWRLYVSCATPGSDHWRVDVVTGADPAHFDPRERRTVLPGDETVAVKDPVVVPDGDGWLLWACFHPLDDPEATDRMHTRFARSGDGLRWEFEGRDLAGAAGRWDERGFRVACVLRADGGWVAYYDGRASKAANAEERTGLAAGDAPSALRATAGSPAATSPWGTGSLRYVAVVDEPAGGRRLFFEACLADGGHGLFTQVAPAGSPPAPAGCGS